MTAISAAYVLWLLFLTGWWVAALWTAKARSRGSRAQRLIYLAGFAVAFGLLFAPPPVHGPHGLSALRMPLWRGSPWPDGLLVALELAGFAFAWWARLHLGRLWSGMLTLREGHRVVDSGPYRLVRHPIYTGFIAAGWALALLAAIPAVLAGAAMLTLVMGVKAGAEERLLRRELGEAAYDDYARRTPMLLPWPK